MPSEPGGAAPSRPSRPLYLYVILSAVLPALLLMGLVLLTEPRIIQSAAQSVAEEQLCAGIQDMRSGVFAQLDNPTWDHAAIAARLRTGFGATNLRWGLRVGDFVSDIKGLLHSPLSLRLINPPDVAEGTRFIELVPVEGAGTFMACSQVHDLTEPRFAGANKAVYAIAWPIANFDTAQATAADALRRSGYLRTVWLPVFLIFAIAVVAIQLVIFYPNLRALRDDINDVLHGRSDRLRRQYPQEIHPIMVVFNEVIASNEAALKYTRTLITKIAHDLNNKLQSLVSTIGGFDRISERERLMLRRQVEGITSQIERYRQLAGSSQADAQAKWSARSFDLIEFVEDTLWVQRIDLTNQAKTYRLRVGGVLRSAEEEALDDAAARPTIDVLCHKGDLEIMLANLLSNASKYGGGLVEIAIEHSGKTVTIHVDDDGPGIPEADRARVFDEGTMLNPDQKLLGTGFGLDIVAMIAGINLGEVRVGDSPLGGARFSLILPIAATG